MSKRCYADLPAGYQTHYRRAGSGAPLLLLHPSPMSSGFMQPLIDNLCDLADVIAPDTPGYGNSDPLPNPSDDLSAYVQWLGDFIQTLGFDRVGLYGSATGAQIAIEFANTYPEKLHYLLLDNAAHFNAAERQEILRDYLPDLSPNADGSHLQQVWEIATALYQWFPWYQQDEAHRVGPATVPVELVHATALEYLRAGPDYGRAYRAAFMNEDAARVQSITVPVRVIRWQGSILKTYSDRYDDFAWPEHIQMLHCEKTPEARLQAIRQAVVKFLA